MKPNSMLSRLLFVFSFVLLTACSGSSEDAPAQSTEVLSDVSYTISGQAFGIVEPIEIAYGDSSFEISNDGRFELPEIFGSGDEVSFSVLSEPAGYGCWIDASALFVDEYSISNLIVFCQRNAFSVGGAAFGVNGSVTLGLGEERLELRDDGQFAFNGLIKKGTEYEVKVIATSPGLSCDARLASGKLEGQVTWVRVVCSDGSEPQLPEYFLGGKAFLKNPLDGSLGPISEEFPLVLSGVVGETEQEISVKGNDFVFSDRFEPGQSYSFEIKAEPDGYVCELYSGEGEFNGSDISDMRAICKEGYSQAGRIAGLYGNLVFRLGDQVVGLFSDNANEATEYRFLRKFDASVALGFEIIEQPAHQECVLDTPWPDETSIFVDSDRTDINLSCVYVAHRLGGNISGLDGELVLLAGKHALTVSQEGEFEFSDRIAGSDNLELSVSNEPLRQSCEVMPSNIELRADRLDGIDVSCSDAYYSLFGAVSGLSNGSLELEIKGNSSDVEANSVVLGQDGGFTWPESIPKGEQLTLSLRGENPEGLICHLDQTSLEMFSDQSFSIACRPSSYLVSATVRNLDGEVELTLDEQESKILIADGVVTFDSLIDDGASVQVAVSKQPEYQNCEVLPETLSVTQGSVSVDVDCRYTHHLVSGAVQGLSGEITLRSGEQELIVDGSQSFNFPLRISGVEPLAISIDSVAEHYRCSVSGAGILLTSDYDQVLVSCLFGSSISGVINAPERITSDSDINDLHSVPIPNDTFEEAQNIYGFAAVHGFVSASASSIERGWFSDVEDRDDIFLTRLEAGQSLVLNGSPTERDQYLFDLDMELFKESQADDGSSALTPVATSYNSGASEEISITETGRYYIRIRAVEGAGTYALETLASNASVLVNSAVSAFSDDQLIISLETSDKRLRTIAAPLGGSLDHFNLNRAALLSLESLNGKALSLADQELAALNPDGLQRLLTLRRAKELSLRADVRIAEPNYFVKPTLISGEPLEQYQWEHERINLNAAWDITVGEPTMSANGTTKDIIVAVIDTGIQSQHEEFVGKLVQGYDFVSDPSLAMDGTGIDDDPEELPGPNNWHGSKVASVIAANTRNGLGMAGVSWGAKIMPLQIFDKYENGSCYDLTQSILYAAGLENNSGSRPSQVADIINMSLGGESFCVSSLEAIDAARSEGVIIVAASGNDGMELVSYPASYHGVISVGATNYQGGLASYSTYNNFLDIAAPAGIADPREGATDLDGDGYFDAIMLVDGSPTGTVLANGQLSGYSPGAGTSFASPVVSGVIALMKSVYPELTPMEVDALLASGSLTNDLGPTGHDKYFGHGIVDALKAVNAAKLLKEDPDNYAIELPDLRVSNREFRFTSSTLSARLVITNSTLHGGIQSVISDQDWLSIHQDFDLSLEANAACRAENASCYRLSVDTRDLLSTDYTATISVTDTDGVVQSINVFLVLQSIDGQRVDAPMYVRFYSDLGLVKEIEAEELGFGVWRYETDRLVPGSYEIIAQSDVDENGDLCVVGELCGFLLGHDGSSLIELGLEDVTGADITTELLTEDPR